MVLDVTRKGPEGLRENVDFAKNVLVIGTGHFLSPEEKSRIEGYVRDAGYVCIEWDEIRDNEVKGLEGGYNDYLHKTVFGMKLKGDHLHANWIDALEYAGFRGMLRDNMRKNAVKRGGVHDRRSPDANEFLYIQELCEQYGKPCYFVDKLTSHTTYRVMQMAKEVGITDAFKREAQDRSRYMEGEVRRISQERFAQTGRDGQCALFVGEGHLKDFSGARFRKAPLPEVVNGGDVTDEGFDDAD